MGGASSFADLDAAIRAESKALATTRTTAAYRRESEAIAFEEIHASCRQAGALLDEHALRALIERGLALGDRPLREYLIASGYADAARFVQTAEAPRPNQPLLRQDEIVELHARATRLLPEARPGAWRVTTSGALHSGMVPPPFWLVPREIAAVVDRFGRVPPRRGALWGARAEAGGARSWAAGHVSPPLDPRRPHPPRRRLGEPRGLATAGRVRPSERARGPLQGRATTPLTDRAAGPQPAHDRGMGQRISDGSRTAAP